MQSRRTVLICSATILGIIWFAWFLQFLSQQLVHEYFEIQLYATRVFIFWCSLVVIISIVLFRKEIAAWLISFFSESTAPINLAIFRVVVFFLLYQMLSGLNPEHYFRAFSSVEIIPEGVRWLVPFLPIYQEYGQTIAQVAPYLALAAALGIASIVSAPLAALAAFILLPLPFLEGKISHYHHLFWFSAVLSFGPIGHTLSIDSLVRRLFKGKSTLEKSPAYYLPIKFCWLLMGVLYFFAGIWKLWLNGLDWIFGDTLKALLFAKWIELDGWTPSFRIDQHPLLLHSGALLTIAFELSFLVLVLFRKTRIFAVLGGLAFHGMTQLFMRISFSNLLLCYVSLVDWSIVAQKLRLGGKTGHANITPPHLQHELFSPRLTLVWLIGLSTLVGNIWCSLGDTHSWPYSAYPHFGVGKLPEKIGSHLTAVVYLPYRQNVELTQAQIRGPLDTSVFKRRVHYLLLASDNEQRAKELTWFWQRVLERNPQLHDYSQVEFYSVELCLKPLVFPLKECGRKLIWSKGPEQSKS